MDSVSVLFLNKLPTVYTEIRMIDGREEKCLILPMRDNQIFKTKDGDYTLKIRHYPTRPNPQQITHNVALQPQSGREYLRLKKLGKTRRMERLGYTYAFSEEDLERRRPRDNSKAADIIADGEICLDDIPPYLIHENRALKKHFARCTFKAVSHDGTPILVTGTLDLDEIFPRYIWTNPETGKRMVNCRFKKMEYMDRYYNTHALVVITPTGTELEIGRFREWKDATKIQRRLSRFRNMEEAMNAKNGIEPDDTPKKSDNNDGIVIEGLKL